MRSRGPRAQITIRKKKLTMSRAIRGQSPLRSEPAVRPSASDLVGYSIHPGPAIA